MKVKRIRPMLLSQKYSLKATAPKRKTRAKLPNPKQSDIRNSDQRYPILPPQFATSTPSAIMSGWASRLWSAFHVKRYDTDDIRVKAVSTATVSPEYL